MGFLNRFKKGGEDHHQAWLEQHPDKAKLPSTPAGISHEEQERMRAQMEHELDAQRSQRQP